MSGTTIKKDKQKNIRIILLAAQILLPFALYLAMTWDSLPIAILTAVLLGLDMAVLVWMG